MIALFWFAVITICCLVIWRASDGFEVASEYLGRNLSEGVRGATINAIGSSIPELFTTAIFLFALDDVNGFAGGIGTTAGSAIFNGVIIPAAVTLVVLGFGIAKSIQLSQKVILRDGIALLLCEAVLIVIISGSTLDWYHGLILMALYVIYIVYMFSSMKKGANQEEEEDDEDEDQDEIPGLFQALITLDLENIFIRGRALTTANSWILLIAATAVLGFSCYYLVYACEGLGHELGIPVYFVAVILAAAATSVPDTIISIRDGMKGNYDDAISNALGSNIFDICFALGLPLFIYTLMNEPIAMTENVIAQTGELRVFLIISTFIAFLIFLVGKYMTRGKAYGLLSIYGIFVTYIVGRAMGWDSLKGIAEAFQEIASIVSYTNWL